MSHVRDIYNWFLATAGAFVGFAFGGFSGVLKALIIFIVMDFITGVCTGVAEKNLSSETAFRGILRKFYELMIVSACHFLDIYVLGTNNTLLTAICFLFISTEGISLLENAARLGVPIPKQLIEILSQLKVTSAGILKSVTTKSSNTTSTKNSETTSDSSTCSESSEVDEEKK